MNHGYRLRGVRRDGVFDTSNLILSCQPLYWTGTFVIGKREDLAPFSRNLPPGRIETVKCSDEVGNGTTHGFMRFGKKEQEKMEVTFGSCLEPI